MSVEADIRNVLILILVLSSISLVTILRSTYRAFRGRTHSFEDYMRDRVIYPSLWRMLPCRYLTYGHYSKDTIIEKHRVSERNNCSHFPEEFHVLLCEKIRTHAKEFNTILLNTCRLSPYPDGDSPNGTNTRQIPSSNNSIKYIQSNCVSYEKGCSRNRVLGNAGVDYSSGIITLRNTDRVGEKRPAVHLVIKHETALKILNDPENFSSNPWGDSRLIALNTMDRDSHRTIRSLMERFFLKKGAQEYRGIIGKVFIISLCYSGACLCPIDSIVDQEESTPRNFDIKCNHHVTNGNRVDFRESNINHREEEIHQHSPHLPEFKSRCLREPEEKRGVCQRLVDLRISLSRAHSIIMLGYCGLINLEDVIDDSSHSSISSVNVDNKINSTRMKNRELFSLVDRLIEYNRIAVKLATPLGGIGRNVFISEKNRAPIIPGQTCIIESNTEKDQSSFSYIDIAVHTRCSTPEMLNSVSGPLMHVSWIRGTLTSLGHKLCSDVIILLRVVIGLLRSIHPVLSLVRVIGPCNVILLLRPDLSLRNKFPYSGIFESPELLPQVVMYLILLNELFVESTERKMIHANDKTPRNLVSELKSGEMEGKLSRAQTLIILAQMTITMTTANAMLNLVHRFFLDPAYRTTTGNGEMLNDEEGGTPEVSSCRTTLDDNNLLTNCIPITSVVHKALREECPLMRLPRTALRDVEFDDFLIRKRDIILIMLGAANADSRKEEGYGLTFGSGRHYCIGRHLVEVELEVLTELMKQIGSRMSLFSRIPPERLTKVDVGNFGFEDYHILWD